MESKVSFELSFSPEFFFGEEDPYDVGPSDRPDSVWQAIVSMSDNDRADVASALGVEAEFLTPEAILDAVRETNTCTTLSSPVEVWIDPSGDCRVLVYDSRKS
jgi:hypothetical protein